LGTRKQAGRLIALGLGVLLGLIASEGLVQVVWTAQHGTSTDRGGYSDRFLDHHERFGWLGLPGKHVRHRTTEFDIAIEINARGLRQATREPEPGTRSICLLGDSFVFGQGVEEHERVGEQLEVLKPELRVHGLALPGIGTDQELLLYRELDGPHTEAEVVVLFYFLENVDRNTARTRHGLAKPWFELEDGALHLHGVPVPEFSAEHKIAPAQTGAGARSRAWLRRHSSLYHLLRRHLIVRSPGALAQADDLYPDYAARGPAWQLTIGLLTALRDAAGERGAAFALVIVPERWHLDDDRARTHQEAVLEACAQLEVPALDLTQAFIESSADRGRRAYYPTDGHWNPGGHAIAARALLEFLEAQDLIE
jgi:hypothetical protein